MQNVTVQVKGDLLILTVDMSKRLGKSTSGKTTIVGSSQGNVHVPSEKHAEIQFGLNVFTKGE